jgi:hypothetical protein
MRLDDVVDSLAGFINPISTPILKLAEDYWMWLLLAPLIPILWAILHYGFNII